MWRVCLVDRDGTFRFYPWISKPVDLFGYTSADGWGGPGEELLIIGWMHIRELNSLAPLVGRFFMLLGMLSISRPACPFIVHAKASDTICAWDRCSARSNATTKEPDARRL